MAYLDQIVELMNVFVVANEENPTRVFIPNTILNKLMLEFKGPMVAEVMKLGWKALGDPPRLFGMEVIRGGTELRVE
jgi:hypothetical protein